MIRKVVFAAALAGFATAAVAAERPQWPSGAQDESDPRVVAFYQGQCKEWADENKLSGEKRDGFIQKCLKNMPNAYPVGYEKEKGAGEEG